MTTSTCTGGGPVIFVQFPGYLTPLACGPGYLQMSCTDMSKFDTYTFTQHPQALCARRLRFIGTTVQWMLHTHASLRIMQTKLPE